MCNAKRASFIMTTIEININGYAQNKLSHSQIMDWFDQFSLTKQKDIRDKSIMLIEQSHPTEKMISTAIKAAQIKSEMTPVVLLKTQIFKIAINKIKDLTDTYRREIYCKNGSTNE